MDYGRAKNLIKSIDIVDVFKAAMEAAEIIGNEEGLHGKQKSVKAAELVKDFINDFRNEKKITEQEYNNWNNIVDTSGEIIFSLVTLASKGKVLINHVMTGCKGCCVLN